MVGLVIVTHGKMAAGLLDAVRMITGIEEGLEAIGLKEEDDVEGLMGRIEDCVNSLDRGQGVILFVDLYGASPFNASARLALSSSRDIEVITGVNLPMLVELVMQREDLSLSELAKMAVEVGGTGICRLSDSLRKK